MPRPESPFESGDRDCEWLTIIAQRHRRFSDERTKLLFDGGTAAMPDEVTVKAVWDSLVDRAEDPLANAIGERFAAAAEDALVAVRARDVALHRYLGNEYDAVLRRTHGLTPEDAARIISDRVMSRIATGSPSPADLRAISDSKSRIGELDRALRVALDGLRAAFDDAVEFLRSRHTENDPSSTIRADGRE